MAVLPHSEAEAKSLRDIAQAMGLHWSSVKPTTQL